MASDTPIVRGAAGLVMKVLVLRNIEPHPRPSL